MYKAFIQVFKNWKYLLLTILVFIAVMKTVLLLPNLDLLLKNLFSFGYFSTVKLSFVLLGSLFSNHTLYSTIGLLVTALLFGINISLFVFYVKRRHAIHKKAGLKTSTLGFVLGLLGIGCASCGSLAVAGVLSLVGLGGLLSILPFGGEELVVLGIIFLLFSLYKILKMISSPEVCRV